MNIHEYFWPYFIYSSGAKVRIAMFDLVNIGSNMFAIPSKSQLYVLKLQIHKNFGSSMS